MRTKTRLPADLSGIRLAVLALSDVDKLVLRQSLTDQVKLCNADTNQSLFGDARWRIGQMVTYLKAGQTHLGVLLGGGAVDVTVWPVHQERADYLTVRWEDLVAMPEAPRVPCERLASGDVIVTERGRAKAECFADYREERACQPVSE